MDNESVQHYFNSLCAQAKHSIYNIDCSTFTDDSVSKSHKSKGQSTDQEIRDVRKKTKIIQCASVHFNC